MTSIEALESLRAALIDIVAEQTTLADQYRRGGDTLVAFGHTMAATGVDRAIAVLDQMAQRELAELREAQR